MSLFNFKNHILTLSRVEIAAVPEFNALIRRDKGSEGDSDGRRKLKAYQEFLYIFYVYDYESPIAKLPDTPRITKALTLIGLPSNWKPDKDVKAAIKTYLDLQNDLSPTNKVLISLERGLNLSSKIIDSLVSKMERTLALVEEASNKINTPTDFDKLEVPGAITPVHTTVFPDITPLVSDMNTLISLSERIPSAIKTIEVVREKVNQEKGSSEIIRGGREKRNREDPTYLKELEEDMNA